MVVLGGWGVLGHLEGPFRRLSSLPMGSGVRFFMIEFFELPTKADTGTCFAEWASNVSKTRSHLQGNNAGTTGAPRS